MGAQRSRGFRVCFIIALSRHHTMTPSRKHFSNRTIALVRDDDGFRISNRIAMDRTKEAAQRRRCSLRATGAWLQACPLFLFPGGIIWFPQVPKLSLYGRLPFPAQGTAKNTSVPQGSRLLFSHPAAKFSVLSSPTVNALLFKHS